MASARTRKLATGANALVFGVITVGILVVVNLLSARVFSRVDLTEGKVYTLSQASKQIVANLPDRLTVKAFISKDLPPRVAQVARYIKDLLDEYATYSKGKMSWEVIDPADGPSAMQEANRMQVQAANIQVYEKSKVSLGKSYLGIGFAFGDKVESIPLVAEPEGLEYEITSIIKRLSVKKKKLGFSQGHGEPNQAAGLAVIRNNLEQYEVVNVQLKDGQTPVPEDVDALLVVGPQEPLSDRALYEIDRFLMRGKAVGIFLDGMVLETPRGQMPPGQLPPQIARANETRLGDLLKHHGVTIHPDLVMDRQNARVILRVGPGQMALANFPAFPIVTELAKDHPAICVTQQMCLKGVMLAFPSSMELRDDLKKGGTADLKAWTLARTTPASWRHKEIYLFDPVHQPPETDDKGPFTLGVAMKGKLKSFFAGKPVPEPGPAPGAEPGAGDGDGAGGDAAAVSEPSDAPGESPASARLVVIADSDFPRDQHLRSYRDNGLFMLNLIDWLAEDEQLIAVRGKGQQSRPLRAADEQQVAAYKYGNTIGLPALFVVGGILRWRLRRRRLSNLKLDHT